MDLPVKPTSLVEMAYIIKKTGIQQMLKP